MIGELGSGREDEETAVDPVATREPALSVSIGAGPCVPPCIPSYVLLAPMALEVLAVPSAAARGPGTEGL